MSTADVETFEMYRPLLFSIAYRMLGSVMEAEDIVQETYLRYHKTAQQEIQSLKAFLTTITTRLCLDFLKSAKVKRESYIGPWLPEPLITEDTSLEFVKQQEEISLAFMVLLENLSPVERAIYLLREVFEYSYAEIAPMVGKNEANCRQYYRNAKQYLISRRPRFKAEPAAQRNLIERFWDAATQGNLDGLLHILAEDAILWSDGGGKVAAARRPLHGRAAIARLLVGSASRWPADLSIFMKEVNGRQSLLFQVNQTIIGVMNFLSDDTKIHEIRAIWNPDKLQHLQTV